MDTLTLDIHQRERNAETLLRMFDIELTDTGLPSTPSKDSTYPLGSLARSCENPFLSTPLRLKHFSRLSPTVLRELLRSPSFRQETPDNSYTSDLEPAYEDSGKSTLQVTGYDSTVFPLTPPLTAQLSALNRFPFEKDAEVPFSSGSVNVPELSDDFDSQSDRITTGNEDSSPDSCLCPSPRRCLIQHANTLLSSAALRNFRRVINELQGIEDDPDKRRRTLVSSLRVPMMSFPCVDTVRDLPTCSAPCFPRPDVAHPPLISKALRPADHPDRGICQTRSTSLCSSLQSLEEEFIGLLLQKAAEEEADANQLRILSGRLERLAKASRNLAAMYRRI